MIQMNLLRSYTIKHYNKRILRLEYILKYTNHSKKKDKLNKRINHTKRMIKYYEDKIGGNIDGDLL